MHSRTCTHMEVLGLPTGVQPPDCKRETERQRGRGRERKKSRVRKQRGRGRERALQLHGCKVQQKSHLLISATNAF